MTDSFVIGCDVGSQGTNAALYGADSELVASAYEAYDLSFPHPGWAEQDPDLWTSAIERACRRLVSRCPGGRPRSAVSPSVPSWMAWWSATRRGAACTPLITGMDRRAEAQAAALAERDLESGLPQTPSARTSTPPAPCSRRSGSATRSPVVARGRASDVAGHVRAPTTGVTAVDPSNASSMALLDARTKTWSPEVLEATEIDQAMLRAR